MTSCTFDHPASLHSLVFPRPILVFDRNTATEEPFHIKQIQKVNKRCTTPLLTKMTGPFLRIDIQVPTGVNYIVIKRMILDARKKGWCKLNLSCITVGYLFFYLCNSKRQINHPLITDSLPTVLGPVLSYICYLGVAEVQFKQGPFYLQAVTHQESIVLNSCHISPHW